MSITKAEATVTTDPALLKTQNEQLKAEVTQLRLEKQELKELIQKIHDASGYEEVILWDDSQDFWDQMREWVQDLAKK
jgi:hypothetical protein